MRLMLAFAVACGVLLAACAADEPSELADSTEFPYQSVVPGVGNDVPADALFGVAGFIPPNFPDSSSEDYETLFDSFEETGPLFGVYLNWRDEGAQPGEIPEAVRTAFQLAEDKGIVPVVAIGAARDVPGGAVEPTVDWDDPAERQGFIAVAVAIATEYEAPYLALGGEVNRLWETSPADFDAFVALYLEAYDAVKAARPETTVFTIFQLEYMKGEGFLSGQAEMREPEWELIEMFEGKLDLVGFTTYPFFDFTSPADIPQDYYREVAERVGKPIALTEIGWPSAPLSSAPMSDYGGSPAEQVEFVERLPVLFAGATVSMAVWAFPYDIGGAIGEAFESVSLRENNGTPKAALEAWQHIAGID
ncbi:MAG: hypothetical protein WEC33_03670 [Dehalococcoidia bacterium]